MSFSSDRKPRTRTNRTQQQTAGTDGSAKTKPLVSVYLPDPWYDRLSMMAERECRPKSNLLLFLLQKYWQENYGSQAEQE